MFDDPLLTWFRRVTWLGIAANVVAAGLSMVQTAPVLALLGLPPAVPLVWPRFAAFLLILLSVFYIPAALDPVRNRFAAWVAIICRFGGVGFFSLIGSGYIVFGLFDFVFGLPELILLTLGLRRIDTPRRPPAAPAQHLRPWLIGAAVVLVIVAGAGWVGYDKLLRRVFPVYAADVEHFKYGSIGNDDANGLPYLIWRVLPQVFAEHLPGPDGYASLGFVWEAGHDHADAPVGFSRARVGFERMAINCAFCHAAVARTEAGGLPVIYPGGASSTVNVLGYQTFLTDCARDPRFTADVLLPAIEQVGPLSVIDRLLYRYVIIPATRKALLKQGEAFAWVASRPAWGPGRIDPFNPVKFGMLGLADDGTIGNSDMEPVWGLDARDAIRPHAPLHWDGLNTSVHEVIVSSALGDGATASGFDWASIDRIERFLRSTPPPASPFKPDAAVVARGQAVFATACAACHAGDGARTLTVIPLAEIGTDRHRDDMWTTQARDAYNTYRQGYDWGFKSFQKAEGYVAEPLNAVWLRGPFLHNGSVPTVADLLQPAEQRPTMFVRGATLVDGQRIGFESKACAAADRIAPAFCYDTGLPGNSNAGHGYGTDLAKPDKDALLAYLLTL